MAIWGPTARPVNPVPGTEAYLWYLNIESLTPIYF